MLGDGRGSGDTGLVAGASPRRLAGWLVCRRVQSAGADALYGLYATRLSRPFWSTCGHGCHGSPPTRLKWSESSSSATSEARKNLFPLIERVNDDRQPVEITSKRGDAVLLSRAG